MDHHWAMRFVVLANVFELKALRQIEVSLHRSQLPQPANRVFNPEIDFRAVEGGFTFDPLVRNPTRVESGRHLGFSLLPIFFRSKVEFVSVASLHRKLELNLVKTERL